MVESWEELHEGVGVGAGGVEQNGRRIPVVMLSFVEDRTAIADMEIGVYHPYDGRWRNYALTLLGARQLLADLQEAVDQAIAGPDAEHPDGWEKP